MKETFKVGDIVALKEEIDEKQHSWAKGYKKIGNAKIEEVRPIQGTVKLYLTNKQKEIIEEEVPIAYRGRDIAVIAFCFLDIVKRPYYKSLLEFYNLKYES